PQVMNRFAGNIGSEINIEQMITEKLSSIPINQLGNNFPKEKRMLSLTGALIGLIIGIVNLLLILLL
uniref:hypothetical protein n=1 Tax=Klebsiella pneumoniae TaxID=573 RepID=UPI00190F5F0F